MCLKTCENNFLEYCIYSSHPFSHFGNFSDNFVLFFSCFIRCIKWIFLKHFASNSFHPNTTDLKWKLKIKWNLFIDGCCEVRAEVGVSNSTFITMWSINYSLKAIWWSEMNSIATKKRKDDLMMEGLLCFNLIALVITSHFRIQNPLARKHSSWSDWRNI